MKIDIDELEKWISGKRQNLRHALYNTTREEDDRISAKGNAARCRIYGKVALLAELEMWIAEQ